jgi:indoleamine 2,3-dioxygenase
MENLLTKKYTDGFFNVSKENGFLPMKDPLSTLPLPYRELQSVINNLKNIIKIPNLIIKELYMIPDYSSYIKEEEDIFVLQALYRAYTFLCSAYTLELSYQHFIKEGTYGKARTLIPEHISVPLVIVSNKLKVYPWLDYHYSYSLGNYVKKDLEGDLHWKNLKMACSFTDSSDEIGFIMLHVYINELSPQLVGSILDYTRTRETVSLKKCSQVMKNINDRRREMWEASDFNNYNNFRIFIMGIKGNNEIFDEGVIYKNCFGNVPQSYRGQTGAQDNIIPMMDIFTGIVDYYPENKLTEYLLDLRTYRPVCIQEFLEDLRSYYKKNPILKTLSDQKNIEGLLYLYNISNEIYFFRNGHWQFVQKYIMQNTNYQYATGGTPITSWLINQIEAVLSFQNDVINAINAINVIKSICNISDVNAIDVKIKKDHEDKKNLLQEQVIELNKLNYNVELIYIKNKIFNLGDN